MADLITPVFAFFTMALYIGTSLCMLFYQEGGFAQRTGLREGPIPGNEFTIRIAGAAVKDFSRFRSPFRKESVTARLRAMDVQGYGMDDFAGGITSAAKEFSIPPRFYGQRFSALLTDTCSSDKTRNSKYKK